MCWLLILLLNWLLTPGQVLWAVGLLTLLLRKEPFSMRSRLTWFEPSARLISWQSAHRSSSIPRPLQAISELKGSAKAPGSREARRLTLPQLMAATEHDLLRDPLKLQGQWHCSRCEHTIAHKQLREWAVERALCPAVAHDASGPFPRWSARFDRPAGNAWLSQIGLQAGYLMVRGVRLLGWASSAARNFSRPCTGQSTKAARDVLARLDKGLTPQTHVQWQSPHQ